MNYLASPPLVVAYALAGTMDVDLTNDPLGHDADGAPVYLRDLWPAEAEVAGVVASVLDRAMFERSYATILDGDENWRALPAPTGDRYEWDPDSTYIRRPTFLEGITAHAPAPARRRSRARARAARRQRHHRPHLAGGRDPRRRSGGRVAPGARRRARRLQLVRIDGAAITR